MTIDATEFLEWNQTGYIAKGDAHVKQGDTSIKADRIASYQPDSASRDLQRIIATGD